MAAIEHKILRNGKGQYKIAKLTARKAIQEHCKECVGFNSNEVRRCTSPNCALFPFRLYTTPKGTLTTPEERHEDS